MMNWLIAIVMWCSIVVGWILAIVAEEELVAGRKYFEWLRIGLFWSALVVLGFVLLKERTLSYLVLILWGIGLGIIHYFLKKVSFWKWMVFEIFSFVWATIVMLMWSEKYINLGLLFVSLLFIYGLAVGTLLNIKYNLKYKS